MARAPPTYAAWRALHPTPSDAACARRAPTAEPWLTALLTVTFHADRGPQIDSCHPPDALGADERECALAHAMPDSAASGRGSETAYYAFRIARRGRLLLAHALFRQVLDPAGARGCTQRAVVLVTGLDALGAARAVLRAAAAAALAGGGAGVVEEVCRWPKPGAVRGEVARLGVGGGEVVLRVPDAFRRSFAAPEVVGGEEEAAGLVRDWVVGGACAARDAAAFHEVALGAALGGAVRDVVHVVELLALGEAVAVLAATPSACSAAVLALVGALHPLPYAGDWRPYLCIQDPDFARFADGGGDAFPRGALVGVTSPHVLGALRIRHVVRVGEDGALRGGGKPAWAVPRGLGRAAKAGDLRACVREKVVGAVLRAFDRYLTPMCRCMLGSLDPSDSALAHVRGAGGGERCSGDPFARPATLRAFDAACFPTSDDLSVPGVLSAFRGGSFSRGRARAFYARFVHTPVFEAWWPEARAEAERTCERLHRDGLLRACRGEGGGRAVDEVVDLCLRVRMEMASAPKRDIELRDALTSFLYRVSAALPGDLVDAVGSYSGGT